MKEERYAHLLRPLLARACIDVINFDRRDSDKIDLFRKSFLLNYFLPFFLSGLFQGNLLEIFHVGFQIGFLNCLWRYK